MWKHLRLHIQTRITSLIAYERFPISFIRIQTVNFRRKNNLRNIDPFLYPGKNPNQVLEYHSLCMKEYSGPTEALKT